MILSLFLLASTSWAFEPPPLTSPVMDLAQVLEPSDRSYLESQIRKLQRERGVQAQILTLPSLENEPIEMVSIQVVDRWQLGSKEKDNGLLILVAPNEKKVRIEVGQGLEGDIPDVLAFQIIQQKILPEFRSNQYGKGLIAALGAIEALLSPETSKAARESIRSPRSHPKEGIIKIIVIIFIFLILTGFGGGGRRGRRGNASAFLAGALLGGMRGGRGGFGGGGWSGGGGGFSGGGASGGW